MSRFPWLTVLLLPLAVNPAAAQTPLGWRWKVGDEFFVEWKADVHTVRETKGAEGKMDEHLGAVCRLKVLQLPPGGGVVLEQKVESVEAKTVAARVDPKLLHGAVLTATLDGNMNVTRLEGIEEVLRKRFGEGALPPQAKFVRVEIEDLCRAWLEESLVALPGKAVQVGEKWSQKTYREMVPVAKHVLAKTFAVAGMETVQGREVVRIAVTAESSLALYKEDEFCLPYRILNGELKEAAYSGTLRFDPAVGRVVQSVTQTRTRLCAVLTAFNDRRPGGATQTTTTTVRILDRSPLAEPGPTTATPPAAPVGR